MRRTTMRRVVGLAAAWALVLLTTVVVVGGTAVPAEALAPVNPVEVDLNGHPANSGFLAFIEGNTTLRSDESEGTMATGGDLHVQSNYNVAAGAAPQRPTFTAAGDAGPTFLYVGGGISWDVAGAHVNVENAGFSKVADTSTYSAFNRDNNNAQVNYRIVRKGSPYNSEPFIDGRTNQQTPASIGTPVPTSQIDIPGAFARYRDLTRQMAACPQNVVLRDAQGAPVPRPVGPGSSARITMTPGVTNVLTMTASELDNLSELTFTNPPTASAPLLVNITGPSFVGNIPNLAGVSGNQAPFMLWNFPNAIRVTVTGGATIEGTLYAPNAVLTWIPSQNVEGNIIARAFNHGDPIRRVSVTEIHDFPFNTTLSCEAVEPSAQLTLVKQVVNDDGGTAVPTDWTLSADGPTPITGVSGGTAVTDAEVAPGDYDLSESDGPPGYDASSWTCTGATISGSTVTIADGDDATCTIVNDDEPAPPPPAHLTLVKTVVNDDGGTAVPTDWTLSADGPTPIAGATGEADVTGADVEPGDYDLAEADGPDGYSASDWTCTGASVTGSTVSVEAGDDATCTITNDDVPEPVAHLTLVKTVVNDDGGTAVPTDWTLSADGPTPAAGVSGEPTVTDVEVAPGDYDLAEADGPTGYTASDWTCTGGTQAGSTVSIAAGDDVTCTITNDDVAPPVAHLTLVKTVVNDDGGTAVPTDWTLSADGPTPISGTSGADGVTGAVVDPGVYDLSEADGPEGYTASGWSCTGATVRGATVTLADGDDATCTITNDDEAPSPPGAAQLTLVKVVVNDDGGTAVPTDWTLSADGPTPISGSTGEPSVTAATVEPGDYDLSEADGPDGYDASAWICTGATVKGATVSLADGDAATCTITNDDSAAPSPPTPPNPPGPGPAPGPATQVLPDTGGPGVWWLVGGLLLVVSGVALTGLSRRQV